MQELEFEPQISNLFILRYNFIFSTKQFDKRKIIIPKANSIGALLVTYYFLFLSRMNEVKGPLIVLYVKIKSNVQERKKESGTVDGEKVSLA
jgi:hypothetical protein